MSALSSWYAKRYAVILLRTMKMVSTGDSSRSFNTQTQLNTSTIGSIRHAAVAGLFYPGDEIHLKHTILQLLKDNPAQSDKRIKACIVPHAGYQYSGGIAAQAYNLLSQQSEQFQKVLIIGPSHRVSFQGLAIPSSDQFETPLGTLSLDSQALNELQTFPFVKISDEAHRLEHSLEVQLPFIQQCLPGLAIIPVVFGQIDFSDIAKVIEHFLAKENTLIIVSSDLSHFLDYQTASRIDAGTSKRIESLDYLSLDHHKACGSTAIQGLLMAAETQNLHSETLAQCNSGDTAGDKSSVVGYASYVIY